MCHTIGLRKGLEMSAKKNLALKKKRVVEMLRVATEFGNGKSTVFDVINQRENYLASSNAECGTDAGSSRKMRGADDDHLDYVDLCIYDSHRKEQNAL